MRSRWNLEKIEKMFTEVAKNEEYTLVDYGLIDKGKHSRITILCHKCGHLFRPTLRQFFSFGQRCRVCNVGEPWTERRVLQLFDSSSDKHLYKLLEYDEIKNKNSMLTLECQICLSIWRVSCINYLGKNQTRCPTCKTSRGERTISEILSKNNVKFIAQYKPNGCKHTRQLSYDFFLEEQNILIEYHGAQHKEVTKFFGGQPALDRRIVNDKIKEDYAITNGYKFIIIWFDEDIENKILQLLKGMNNYDKSN